MKLVYLAGPPAAGKSALMAALTERCRRKSVPSELPHSRLYRKHDDWLLGAEIGRSRPMFPGTDTLAFNIMPQAKHWISRVIYTLVLGEGDRLAKMPFLQAAADAGYEVHLFHLYASPEVLDARCEARGSKQNDTWRKGRATAADNLAAKALDAGFKVYMMNTEHQSVEQLMDAVHLFVPETAALRDDVVHS